MSRLVYAADAAKPKSNKATYHIYGCTRSADLLASVGPPIVKCPRSSTHAWAPVSLSSNSVDFLDHGGRLTSLLTTFGYL